MSKTSFLWFRTQSPIDMKLCLWKLWEFHASKQLSYKLKSIKISTKEMQTNYLAQERINTSRGLHFSLGKEAEGNSHTAFSKGVFAIQRRKNLPYPGLSCSHQSARWRRASRHPQSCCSWCWRRVQPRSREMLEPLRMLFKDVHGT